jgi:DNA replication protein DnaC
MRKVGSIRNWYLDDTEAARLYESHPEIKADPEDYCPTCSTVGEYLWKGKWHKCDCELQLQLHKHYLAAGVGVTYQRLDWEDFQGDPEARQEASDYLERHVNSISRGIGMIFMGDYGTGKTLVTTLMLKDLIKLGYNCYSTTFASMMEMFTAGWKSAEEQRRFQQKIMYSEVLLLDDIGREMRTKAKLSETTFDDVLRRRVQDGRPTFITTNMDMAELSKGYGGAILSLLTEVCLWCEMKGGDFRPQSSDRLRQELVSGQVRPIF